MSLPRMSIASCPWSLCGFLMLLVALTPNPSSASSNPYCVRPDGRNGCYTTIGAAVAAATDLDTVVVSSGTYHEQVVLTHVISLVAADHAEVVIDATGQPNGIFVNGLWDAPQYGVDRLVIRGLKIRNAEFEGILVANASDVTIIDNEVTHNNTALEAGSSTCPGIPAFETNEDADCGEGIHLIAVDHSSVAHNEVWGNAGGILITDETGPSHSNFIAENDVHDNLYACGITLASHAPATSVTPSATVSYGVYNNTIAHNHSWSNGTQSPGGGIGIFAPGPGASAYANVVIDNDIRKNGMGGVVMHNHVAGAGINFSDNQILGNTFAGNGRDTDSDGSIGATGVSIWSSAFVRGTTVIANRFEDEDEDVAFGYVISPLLVHLNNFSQGFGTYTVTSTMDPVANWWHCPSGPGASTRTLPTGRCAGDQTRIPDYPIPWLTTPFPYPYDNDQQQDHEQDHRQNHEH